MSCWKFRSPYLGKAQQPQEQRYPFLSVCAVFFHVSRQCYCCQRLGFLTCTQTLMHAITHGGCTDTVRQSAPEVDSGRKILRRIEDSNPRQYLRWLFSRTALPTELSSLPFPFQGGCARVCMLCAQRKQLRHCPHWLPLVTVTQSAGTAQTDP